MLERIRTHINGNYGSKGAALKVVKYRLMDVAGAFSRYQNVDWSPVDRLVFICMGNICRSPLAEACARLHSVKAISAGVSCTGGAPADPRAIQFAAIHGIDMSAHRSLPIEQANLGVNDLVVGMEPAHLEHPLLAETCKAQVTLLGLWATPRKVYIHDPFCADTTYFERCERYVMEATNQLVFAMRAGKRPLIKQEC